MGRSIAIIFLVPYWLEWGQRVHISKKQRFVQGKCQSEGQEKTEFLSGSHRASTDIVCLSEARILHRVQFLGDGRQP